ncbi:helix-turn-helix transcriptional regulator [Streptomyces antibioticus]|uniref:helix-turn-helix transcriptional regulator n=1 Tax=Streptomyces antibioticus TaxID=1890 RepID=UPI0033BB4196
MTGQTITAPARVVTGEPGCGRTTFLARAVRAHRAGAAVSVAADRAVPDGGLRALLRAVEAADGTGPAVLLDALHAAAAHAPLLVCVDDAHLWDAPSRAVLGQAARRLRGTARVSLLLSVAGHRPVDPEFAGLPVIRLDPLTPAEAAVLLDEVTGGDADPAVRDDLVDAADGNPALLLAMARRLTPAQLRGHRRAPRPPTDAALLTGLAGGCLTGLADAQRDLVLRVAAALTDLDGEEERADARLVLRDARTAVPVPEVLASADGTLRFHSDLVRRAVYESAPPERRRAAHRALAEVLEAEGPQGLGALLHRARASATPPPGTADALAEAAAGPGPHGPRCAAYTRAAELAADATRRAEWYTAAAEHALLAGRAHRARRLLDAARDHAVPRALRGRIELARGTTILHDGPVDEARASLLLAARLLAGADDPRSARTAALAAADAAWAAGDAAGCLQALPRGEDPAGHDAVPSAADYAHGLRALLEGRFPAAARRLGRLVADTETGELPDVPDTLLRAAAAALMLGDLPAARRAGTRALAADHGAGGGVAALAREYLAYTELRAGRHAVARTHAEEGLRAAHRTGRRNTAAHHHAALALAASVDSGLAEVAVHARAALAVARRHGLVQAATLAEWATARADLGHGRPREAADRLGPLVRPGPRRGHFAVWMSAVPCYVEATVSAGRADGGDRRDDGGQGGGRGRGDGRQREGGEAAEVAVVVEEFARWAGFGADPQAPAQLLRCRALLAPPDRADALYRAALGLHDRAEGDFERARTELSYGKWLRRRRRLREARDRLGAALVGFERCGARAWAEQARAELRALGVSAGGRTGTAPGLSGLTPQQLRIARWVAEGATNREVALALSVSTRTVDYHLRKAFAALGVRSRVELARLVERAQPPPDGTGTEIGTSGGHTEIDRAHP